MKKLILAVAALTLIAPSPSLAHRSRQAERIDAGDRVWKGEDGRYRCTRNDGTTGLIIGGATGGVIGNVVAGRGNRTVGTILGAAGGALLGRHIDRKSYRCR